MQLIITIAAIVLAILAPLFATMLQLAISRKREFLADADGAMLTRYPEALASALEKFLKIKNHWKLPIVLLLICILLHLLRKLVEKRLDFLPKLL